MKKVLLACDGRHFPGGAFRFVKALRLEAPLLLKGVFFTPVDRRLLVPTAFAPGPDALLELKEEEEQLVSKSINQFQENCIRHLIEFRTERAGDIWTPEVLIRETRFSDLLVISEELFCADAQEKQPNPYMREILRHTECPVVLVPESFSAIERIIMAYDGKKDSMYAMKEFANLFPQMAKLETEIVYLQENEADEIPEKNYLEEYVNRHFPNATFNKLHVRARKYFATWALEQKNALVVSGSYGRSGISNMLRESFVEDLIGEHCLPMFIAHYH